MYDVDYSMADDFKWGKDLGCDFLMKSCYEYIKIQKSRKKDIQPFCDTPNVKRCTNYENAYGFCSLYKYNQNLPHEYQYMDDMFNVSSNQREFYGGWDLMDYCPYLQTSITEFVNQYTVDLLEEPAFYKTLAKMQEKLKDLQKIG
ncbi:unnamed protein product [Heterobilharzia americana]|nr:unnamed protein product [Heterobilharzia americana]